MSDATNPNRPNGHQLEASELPGQSHQAATPAVPQKAMTGLEALDAMLGPLLFCMARGALALLTTIPGQVVLIALCRVMGKLMGELYIGDEIAVRTFRAECRKQFKAAIMEAPIQALPTGATAPQTAPPKVPLQS